MALICQGMDTARPLKACCVFFKPILNRFHRVAGCIVQLNEAIAIRGNEGVYFGQVVHVEVTSTRTPRPWKRDGTRMNYGQKTSAHASSHPRENSSPDRTSFFHCLNLIIICPLQVLGICQHGHSDRSIATHPHAEQAVCSDCQKKN